MVSVARRVLQHLTRSERRTLRDPKKVSSGWKQLEAAIDAGQKALPIDVHGRLHIVTNPTIWGLSSGYVLSSICLLVAGQCIADQRVNHATRGPLDNQVMAAPWPKSVLPSLAERHLRLGDHQFPRLGDSPLSVLLAPSVSRQPSARLPKSDEGVDTANPQLSDASQPDPSTFDAEFRLIRSAKQALDVGRPRVALDILEEHGRLFPSGIFRTEREGLRVLSLCLLGNSPQSRLEALRYLRSNRQMLMVDRIRRECKIKD